MQTTDSEVADRDEFDRALRRAYSLHRDDDGGQVADYIPELGKASPGDFGLALSTVGGKLYTIGDAEIEFTIQSISTTSPIQSGSPPIELSSLTRT